jgi:hypothetical protein
MMRHLLGKDLKLIARDPAFRVIGLGYLVAYLVASGVFCGGVLAASDPEAGFLMTVLFPRVAALQAGLLAAVTPWLVFRYGTHDGVNGLVRLGAGISAPPGLLVAGRILALAVLLAELICLSFPVMTVVLLLGAATLPQVGQSMVHTYLFLVLLAIMVTQLDTPRRHWALSWVLSYAVLPVLACAWYEISSFQDGRLAAPVGLVSILLLASLSMLRAGRILIYLRL